MADTQISWQELERYVRTVSEMKFAATARAEDIAGVKCDCVIHVGDGSVILIEISVESSIDKLRIDLAKFNTLRPYFIQRNIFPKCYFVTANEPSPSLIAAGEANYVQVYSISQYVNTMLGLGDYANRRQDIPFGSAIDLYSGRPDRNQYVNVGYFSDDGESYTITRIVAELVKGRAIVLVGDYGSGKSRCVKETFEYLFKTYREHYQNAIAINLRDNWGLKRASEMLTRHYTDIGLGNLVPNIMKVADSPSTIYLLDGFDEIGAQTWSDDPTKLVSIRQQSLVGVKDLITRAGGGILVTGREHYFNNDSELITCLGLDRRSPLFLRCNQELSDVQFSEMVGRRFANLPAWVPKKPLIAAIVRDIQADVLDNILRTSTGQIDFWGLLIDTFCTREARINPILDAEIIRTLYTRLARLTRTTTTALGPISIRQINEAFEHTTGRPPTDESAIILQRLPGLSRIGAESLDRQFVDSFILDGLKAEDVLTVFSQGNGECLGENWINPIEMFGAFFIASRLRSTRQLPAAAAFIKRNKDSKNRVILSDIISSVFLCDGEIFDFGGLRFNGGKFHQISLSDASVRNIIFEDCHFNFLDITDAESQGVQLVKSTISQITGVTGHQHLPSWINNCLVEGFQSIATLSAIREAGLTVSQTFLLSSLRKLFLQPGGGRKESSMFKGYGDSATKKVCEKVIGLLVREKFAEKHRGATEPLYVPNRSYTGRVQAIMSQMTTSKDDLWQKASRIS